MPAGCFNTLLMLETAGQCPLSIQNSNPRVCCRYLTTLLLRLWHCRRARPHSSFIRPCIWDAQALNCSLSACTRMLLQDLTRPSSGHVSGMHRRSIAHFLHAPECCCRLHALQTRRQHSHNDVSTEDSSLAEGCSRQPAWSQGHACMQVVSRDTLDSESPQALQSLPEALGADTASAGCRS